MRTIFPAVCLLLCQAPGVLAQFTVGEWHATTDPMPLALHGLGVGARKQLTITVNREPRGVTAALYLLVDDIDAKREAIITCNGHPLPIVDSLLGEGAGFKGFMPILPGKVKQGENVIDFVFADNLGGTTGGYLILEAAIVLQVDEDEVDPARRRYPEAPADAPRGDILHNKIAQLQYVTAQRTQIGHRGLSYTGLTQLPGGDLLALCSYRFEGKRFRSKVYRSADQGATWSPVTTGGEAVIGDRPTLTVLDGGVLLVTTMDRGVFRVFQSDDGGATWRQSHAGESWQPLTRAPIRIDNVAWWLMSSGTYYNRQAPPSRAWLIGGNQLEQRQDVQPWPHPEPMFDECSAVVLDDGAILATGRATANTKPHPMPWTHRANLGPSDAGADHTVIHRSIDSGRTWQTQILTEPGQVHAHLLTLTAGRVLCTFAQQVQPYGIYAMLSEDGGKTWQTRRQYRLASSLDDSGGWPTTMAHKDGSLLTGYTVRPYREHGDSTTFDHVTEAVRWRLP